MRLTDLELSIVGCGLSCLILQQNRARFQGSSGGAGECAPHTMTPEVYIAEEFEEGTRTSSFSNAEAVTWENVAYVADQWIL